MNDTHYRDWLNDSERATSYHPIMKCGHAANAVDTHGYPVCVICLGITEGAVIVDTQPDLTGRMARCYCDKPPIPSDRNEAFFEYRGPGSRHAIDMCKHCPRSYAGHLSKSEGGAHFHKEHNASCVHCDHFEPRGPHEFDLYYCGHAGWD